MANLRDMVGRERIRIARRVLLTTMLMGAAALTYAEPLSAQQSTQQPPSRTQPARRAETIEIRGQVPTPQVVTVRPRETPAYSRRVLVPAFFDRDFWPSILPPLEIVAPTGVVRPDSTVRTTVDSATVARPVAPRPPSGTPPALLRR